VTVVANVKKVKHGVHEEIQSPKAYWFVYTSCRLLSGQCICVRGRSGCSCLGSGSVTRGAPVADHEAPFSNILTRKGVERQSDRKLGRQGGECTNPALGGTKRHESRSLEETRRLCHRWKVRAPPLWLPRSVVGVNSRPPLSQPGIRGDII
jgi:hypothetical protein